jgi:hypothetical protein
MLARPYQNGVGEIDGALPSGQESPKSPSAALRINRRGRRRYERRRQKQDAALKAAALHLNLKREGAARWGAALRESKEPFGCA